MKIALCLSGLPRAVHKSYETIKSHILDKYDVDVFFHTWLEDPYKAKEDDIGNWATEYSPTTSLADTIQIINEAILLYKPKSYRVDQKHIYKGYNIGTHGERYMLHPRYGSMLESIYKANQLKKEFEERGQFKYDCVIRCRFDINICSPIHFRSYDLTQGVYAMNIMAVDITYDGDKGIYTLKLIDESFSFKKEQYSYFMNVLQQNTLKELNDFFSFSSSEHMDKWCSLFLNLEKTMMSIEDTSLYKRHDPHIVLAHWNRLENCNIITTELHISLHK